MNLRARCTRLTARFLAVLYCATSSYSNPSLLTWCSGEWGHNGERGTVFRHAMRSYRCFEQAASDKTCGSPEDIHAKDTHHEVAAEHVSHHRSSECTAIPQPMVDLGAVLETMVAQLKRHSCEFEHLQHAADRYGFFVPRAAAATLRAARTLRPKSHFNFKRSSHR